MSDVVLNNGFHAVGIFHEFKSSPWANDPTKFNHRILLANPFQDANGFNQTDVVFIDVSNQDVERIRGLESNFKGKQVIIPCRFEAKKGGKNGAWLSKFLPKGAQIQPLVEQF